MILLALDLLASLMVPNNGFAQLGLLFWAFPLLLWGVVFQVVNESKNGPGIIAWCLFGAIFIGGWGQAVQSTALDFCGSN